MKTTIPDPILPQKYANFLLSGIGIIFMLMAMALVAFMIATPKKTAVSSTPVPTVEPILSTVDPVQTAVTGEPIIWQREKYTWKLIPRAQIQITGRVLSRKTYNYDWQSEISPLDLAIGWGELYDTEVDKWVKWRQSGRWYFYRWPDEAPYDEKYLRSHSSNIHIVPATESLKPILLSIHEDDRIFLEGRLIDMEAISKTKIWLSETSLTRTDSGEGACEILLVERLIWNGQEYH
jgi:hypothetical protein